MSVPAQPPDIIMDSAIADEETEDDGTRSNVRRFSRRQTRGATHENLEPILSPAERRESHSSAVSVAPESLFVDALRRDHRQRRQNLSPQTQSPSSVSEQEPSANGSVELQRLARAKLVDRVTEIAKEERGTESPPVSPPALPDTPTLNFNITENAFSVRQAVFRSGNYEAFAERQT